MNQSVVKFLIPEFLIPASWLGAVCMLLPLQQVMAADWKFEPGLSLKETYSDNVKLASSGNEQAQWVTQVGPSFKLSGTGAHLKVGASYAWDSMFYTGLNLNTIHKQQLSANANVELVEKTFFIDSKASISHQNTSPLVAQSNDYTNVVSNQSEVRTFSISPLWQNRLANFAKAQVRYSYNHVETDTSALNEGDTQTLSALLSSGNDFKNVLWSLNFNKQISSKNFESEQLSATARYLLNSKFSWLLGAGTEKYSYVSLYGEPESSYWSTGASWRFSRKSSVELSWGDSSRAGSYWSGQLLLQPSSRTNLKASFSERFYGKSYAIDASLRARRSLWALVYSEDISSTQSQFSGIGVVDTRSFLQSMVANSSDPASTQKKVDALGPVPNFLPNPTNLQTNRIFLQKRLQASVALNGSRNHVALNVFTSSRESQTDQKQDSVLLGAQNLSLYDRSKQHGVNVSWNYQVNSRSALNAMVDFTRNDFPAVNQSTNNQKLQLGANKQLSKNINVSAQLRHNEQNLNGTNVQENALTATLSIKF